MIDYSDLIGTPFKNEGRDPHKGLDCYGLVREIYRRFGYEIPEYLAPFNDVELITKLIKGGTAQYPWREVGKNEELPVPCLMTIRFGVPRPYVNHTAVYIGNGRFIHIRENTGVCVDNIESPAWKRVIEHYYEYVGAKKGAGECTKS